MKGRIEELGQNESVFHTSASEYYEDRPEKSDDPEVAYDEEELEVGYWEKLSLSEFCSKYDIVWMRLKTASEIIHFCFFYAPLPKSFPSQGISC